MTYNAGALESTLSAAVGEEPLLIAELRAAFFDSAYAHMAALRAAQSEEARRDVLVRLQGLAASFGATRVLDGARDAMGKVCNKRLDLSRLDRSLSALRDATL